jgi:putative transcriptional regulator
MPVQEKSRTRTGVNAMSLAGSFLVAQSSLIDPNFAQTVVLILAHNDEGAFGLVVNRPAQKAELPFPVFHGGPCPAPGLFMLHGHRDWLEDETPEPDEDGPKREVAPGIFLGDASCLKRAHQVSAGETLNFRAFQGYAGWGPDQLETELSSGAWLTTPADSELLFATPVETLWRLLAPPRLPRPSIN